jgi:hypothetical protein
MTVMGVVDFWNPWQSWTRLLALGAAKTWMGVVVFSEWTWNWVYEKDDGSVTMMMAAGLLKSQLFMAERRSGF